MDMMSMYTSEELTEMLLLRKQIEELQARYNAIAKKSASPAQAAPFQAPTPIPQTHVPASVPVSAPAPLPPQPAPVQYAPPAYTPPPAPIAPVAPVMQAPQPVQQMQPAYQAPIQPVPQPQIPVAQQPQAPAQAPRPGAGPAKFGSPAAPGGRPAASPFFKPGVGPIAKPGPKPAKSPIKIPGMKEQAPAAPATLSSSIYQSIREYAVSILTQSGNPLSFDGLFDRMTSAGCPLPADKPKVIVRKVLCNSPDIFSVTNKGFYTINENYVPGEPAAAPEMPVAQPAFEPQPLQPVYAPQPVQPVYAPQPVQPVQPAYPAANPVLPVQPPQPQVQQAAAAFTPPNPALVLPPTKPLPAPAAAPVQQPPQPLPAPVAASPTPAQPPAATANSSSETSEARDTSAKRALTSSGEGSIRERATAAIVGAGRPLSMDEVYDKLKSDGHPLPIHNAKEVIKIILSNKSLFRVLDNGKYQPISEQA